MAAAERSDPAKNHPEKSHARLEPALYLVGTPIGNLEDITLRALRVLRTADRILCEDTRESQHLLHHFDIQTRAVSCHEHNEEARAAEVVAWVQAGQSVAMISDAGMPGISDPGLRLARAMIAAGLPVVPIPGANAAVAALVGSGLDTQRFLFCGFLSAKAGARRTELERLAALARASGEVLTLVFYEAPHRVLEMLADVEVTWSRSCRVVLARELTKLHEEFLRGPVSEVRAELAGRDRVRGEFVALVEASADVPTAVVESLAGQVRRLIREEAVSEMDALKRAARERGMGKSEAYREWQRDRAKKG
ncbi:MAG: 16S rRNA (cytidine(1402)-2'-O)-methyltransferase [Acidobacteriaceae bacterium]